MEEIAKGFTIAQLKAALRLGWENVESYEQNDLLILAASLGVSPALVKEMTEYGSTGGYAYARANLITLQNTGHLPYGETAAEQLAIEQGAKWSEELRAKVNAPVKEAPMTNYQAYERGLRSEPSYEEQDLPFVKQV